MGEVVSLTLEILKDIRDEVRGLREDVRGTNTRLDRVEGRILQLDAQQAQTNVRLDHLLDLSSRSWRDLERRVTALEQRTGGGNG